MLGITSYSYDAVVWVILLNLLDPETAGGSTVNAAIPDSFDSLVEELRKTSLLPNIRDKAINAMLGITQGNMSYADYTRLFNDFLRRSHQPTTDDLQCVRFISGLATLQLQTQAKSYRSQKRGYTLPLVEQENFLNDIATY
jgi:hypothetical protein